MGGSKYKTDTMERLFCCHKAHMKQLDTNIKCSLLARVAFPNSAQNISLARRGKKRRAHQSRNYHHFPLPNAPSIYIMVVTTIYVTRHGVSPSCSPWCPSRYPALTPPPHSSEAIGPSIRKRAPTQPPPLVQLEYHQTLP